MHVEREIVHVMLSAIAIKKHNNRQTKIWVGISGFSRVLFNEILRADLPVQEKKRKIVKIHTIFASYFFSWWIQNAFNMNFFIQTIFSCFSFGFGRKKETKKNLICVRNGKKMLKSFYSETFLFFLETLRFCIPVMVSTDCNCI